MFTYSVRTLLVLTALVGVLMSAAAHSALAFGVLLAACLIHAGIGLLPKRWCIRLFVVCLVLASLPWAGVSSYSFIYPGADSQLPTLVELIRWNAVKVAVGFLRPLYGIAEVPLVVLAELNEELAVVIHFSRSATVRPFFVFVFWFALAVMCGVSLLFRAVLPKASTKPSV